MRVAAGAAMVLVVLAGCGGGGKPAQPKPEQHRSEGGEEAERVQAVRGIRPADLTAFYQVALADGQLRQWGASHGRHGRSRLKEARRRLRHVHPEASTLVRARRKAAVAVNEALEGGSPRRALRRADRLRAVIDRVIRSDPRFGALMPD